MRAENFIIGTGPTQKAWSSVVGLAQARERQRDDALLAHGAVVGGDVQAGERQRVELLVQDEQVLGAGAHDDVDVLALLAEHAGDGVGDSQADAAADDGHGVAVDLGRQPSGPVTSLM